jgi:2-polyprenyl-3-methyl-5-hydroxy-6-metoxy-1,4-benzoquinol methylase
MTTLFPAHSRRAAMPANQNGPVAVDPAKLEAFVGKMLGDLGGAFTAPLVHLGDKLGLYRDLAKNGSATSMELAQRTGLAERYVREWLANQAASGYLAYDPPTRSYALLPEQAMVFADEDSPVFPEGAFDVAMSVAESLPRHEAAFRGGGGIAWGDHSACLFCAVERFFRPAYRSHLIGEWLPALDGVVGRLKSGGRVADVGCGHGASTVMIAEAFPEAEVVGFDSHAPSIEHANDLARRKGFDNLRFEVADAQSYRGAYDLIACVDSLHDMGDPVAAAWHARSRLAPGGTWMLVEPIAEGRWAEDRGAVDAPARLLGAIRQGGFARARVAARTPFNLVIEATA